MNDSNWPFADRAEVEEVEAEEEEAAVEAEEAEEAHQHQHQRLPNNQYPLQQMSKLWEDFPKYSTEIVLEPMTSSKK
jgi:hypothetical protein